LQFDSIKNIMRCYKNFFTGISTSKKFRKLAKRILNIITHVFFNCHVLYILLYI